MNKTYFTKNWNWKRCNKIIFKYKNSTMWSIFNKKLLKSDIYGSIYSTQIHYLRLKSQYLWLLFINSSHKSPEMHEKKKKKKKRVNAYVRREHGSKPPLSQLSLTDCFIRVKWSVNWEPALSSLHLSLAGWSLCFLLHPI